MKTHEKHRPNQNEQRNSTKEKSGLDSSNQDSSNNNKGKILKTGGTEGVIYHSGHDMGAGSASDNSENVDSDGQPKKGSSKEKLNYNNSNKTGNRIDKPSQQQQASAASNKDRRVKHQPYDAHSRSSVAPRFQQSKGKYSKNTDRVTSCTKICQNPSKCFQIGNPLFM